MKQSSLKHRAKECSKHVERVKAWQLDFETSHANSLAGGQLSLSRNDVKQWKLAIYSARAIASFAEYVMRATLRSQNDIKKVKGKNKKKRGRNTSIQPSTSQSYASTQLSIGQCSLIWDIDTVRNLPSIFTSFQTSGKITETDLTRGFLRVKVSGLSSRDDAIRRVEISADRIESSAFILSRCQDLTEPSSPHVLGAQKVPSAHRGTTIVQHADRGSVLHLPAVQEAETMCIWLSSLIEDFPKSALPSKSMRYLIVDIEEAASRQTLSLPEPILSCGSRLMQTKNQIPGIHTPYAYVSGSISTFSMHVEDAGLASANIVYAGHAKVWVIVSPWHKTKLEKNLKDMFRSTQNCAQFVRHLAPIISPRKLVEWDIDFSIVVQQPGELVITFPFAYHFGFNLGPNRAEAINLTLDPEWRPPKEYRYCNKHCTSQPITSGMLEMKESPVPPYSVDNVASRDAVTHSNDSWPNMTHSPRNEPSNPVGAAAVPSVPPVETQNPEPPCPVSTRPGSAMPGRKRSTPVTSERDAAVTAELARVSGESLSTQRSSQETLQRGLLDAYGLKPHMVAETTLRPTWESEDEKSDADVVSSAALHVDHTNLEHEDPIVGDVVLGFLRASAFLCHRLDERAIDMIWHSRPAGVPIGRAIRALQIAVDIANPRVLLDIRTALRHHEVTSKIAGVETQGSWARRLAHAHMAVSSQTGFVPHAAVVGGAVAQAHYFTTYEAARTKLRERINESRQEKNRARRSRRKATPITEELERECKQLGIGTQKDAAEILKRGIVEELIHVGFAYDRLDTRERVNVFLKQGEVLCRILRAYGILEGPSDKTPARMTVNTALIMLFPGEARDEPELAIHEESLNGEFSLMNAVTMKEILNLPFDLASWLGDILKLIRPELTDVDLSVLPPLIGKSRNVEGHIAKLELEQKTDAEIRQAYMSGGEAFQELFKRTP